MTNRRTEKALRKYEEYEQRFLRAYNDNPKGARAVLLEQKISSKSNSFLIGVIITIIINFAVQGIVFYIANNSLDYLPPEIALSVAQIYVSVSAIVSLFSIFIISILYYAQKARIKDIETKEEILKTKFY